MKILISESEFKNFIITYLPIISWLSKYSFHNLQCDAIAGITVGLMVIPQALAYASIAQLPNHYGLYSSFMGCFVYCILGTSKDVTIGPTAVLSLLVATYNIPHCGEMAVLLSFCTGSVLLIMGIFHLGFLVSFVSKPVISAFCTGASITIACGQLKYVTGVRKTPRDFLRNLIYIFRRIKVWNLYDLGYGASCLVVLLLMRRLTIFKEKYRGEHKLKIVMCKFLWLCGVARNAIIVLLSCLIMFLLERDNVEHRFTLVNRIRPGFPRFTTPNFTIITNNKTFYIDDSLEQFGSGLVIIPLIAFLETIAVGKAFSQLRIQPTQELIALGIANIMGSFVSAFPVTGSFSRTAVNSQSGVKTPLAGLFTGILVLVTMRFLTHMFLYIPKACLGAIIISAVLSMVDLTMIKILWNVRRIELLPYLTTLCTSFYSLEYGLGFGILVSILLILYPICKPTIEVDIKEVTVVRLRSGLLHPGIDNVIEKIEKVITAEERPIAIILDMYGVTQVDYTVVSEIREISRKVETYLPGTDFIATNVNVCIMEVFINSNLMDIIYTPEKVLEKYEGREHLLPHDELN